MAVINAFQDASLAAGKKGNPALVAGSREKSLVQTFEVAAADDNGSIYKLARLPSNAIVTSALINNDAITGGTDYDLGLYRENGDAADADLFNGAALDMSSAAANGSEKNALAGVAIDSLDQKLWELLGKTVDNKDENYVLAITANTVGSAAGTITLRLTYIEG